MRFCRVFVLPTVVLKGFILSLCNADGNVPDAAGPSGFTIPGNLLSDSDSGSEFSDESSDWEDDFNYEFEEGEADAPEQQEELSTARVPEKAVPKSSPGFAPKSPAKEMPQPASARGAPPVSARGTPPVSARMPPPPLSARDAPPIDTSYFVPGAALGQKSAASSRPGTAGAARPASASATAAPSSALPRPKTQEQKPEHGAPRRAVQQAGQGPVLLRFLRTVSAVRLMQGTTRQALIHVNGLSCV
jgi:hypothetical protein